jgi:hypothetical protein
MDTKKSIQAALVVLLSLGLLAGCVTLTSGGLASVTTPDGKTVTLQEMQENWQAYTISYAGTKDIPAALLFDPKNDGKVLSGRSWKPVENRETLAKMVDFIKGYAQFDPKLYAISGPDREVFGYVLSPDSKIRTRVVNDNTVYVYDIESPLYRNDGGRGERKMGFRSS